MSDWSLTALLAGLHDEIEGRLAIARKTIGHPSQRATPAKRSGLRC
jgi:hypothetical protein